MCEAYSIVLMFLCAASCQLHLFQSRLPKGSTDVLMVVIQVSSCNRDDVDVSCDVSMSLVGAVITGVLLWFVVYTGLDQGWPWCRGDWWW